MISRQLVDLLNSGEAVSVVGSGISSDVGLPTWPTLFGGIAAELDRLGHKTTKARDSERRGKLPEAFNLLAALTSTDDIHTRTASRIEQGTTPGKHHERLADWPFRLHVTTNYDHLLEDGSAGRLVAVGNRGSELHKLTGGARDIVWHLHGGSRLPNGISQLVVSKSDYDDFYPSSNAVDKLKALATAHRCVFIGFGFNDEDLIYVLKAVGRVAHHGRPSFAFLGYEGSASASDAKTHQQHLRTDFNIEVIPYARRGNDHDDLHRILDAYAPFVLRHSIRLEGGANNTPDYHPIASSLRIQSSLDIGGLSTDNPSLKRSLLGARVLAYIREHPDSQDQDLRQFYQSGEASQAEVVDCLDSLRRNGSVTPKPRLNLTPDHQSKTEEAEAQLQLTRDRFRSSVEGRVSNHTSELQKVARGRTGKAVEAFFDQLCRERGLGVAQNLATSDSDLASRRTVSLVQQLPEHLAICETRDEALVAINVAADILTRPNEAESLFLGMLCQAYFGQHLARASVTLAQVDLDLVAGTCYLLDASVLICLLADGGAAHRFTKNLVENLASSGALLATTDLFVNETAEHATWAARLVRRVGEQSHELINALRCRDGYRPNQFLDGYFLTTQPDASFAAYIRRLLKVDDSDDFTRDTVADRLAEHGIRTLQFDEWVGFNDDYLARREEIQREISERRSDKGTYKHNRQVQAEAEVALIVDGLRSGALQLPDKEANDGFFVSSTRVVDRLPNLKRRICLLPEGLAQWMWSSQATSPKHADLVFEQLLWELSQGGIEFVDRATLLTKFSGVVEASELELRASVTDRREYLIDKYGPDPAQAFSDADPLDVPRLAIEVHKEALHQMESKLSAAQAREVAAKKVAKLTEKDLHELAILRGEKRERRKKADRQRRAAASKMGKGRKRRRKKQP